MVFYSQEYVKRKYEVRGRRSDRVIDLGPLDNLCSRNGLFVPASNAVGYTDFSQTINVH